MKRIISVFLMCILIFNTFLFTVLADSSDIAVLKLCRFTEKYETFIYQSGGSIALDTINGNGVLGFKVSDGTVSLSYTDVQCPLVSDETLYVVEANVLPVKIEGTSFIKLFDAKTSRNEWRYGVSVKSDGTISMSGTPVGSWQSGKWFRLSIAYNLESGICDLYMDGNFAARKECSELAPTIFRIDANSKYGDGNMEFYVDDIAIYTGNSLVSDFDLVDKIDSVMNLEYPARKYIGDASVYSVGGRAYYTDGQRYSYTSDVQKPVLYDKTVYFPKSFAESEFDKLDGIKTVLIEEQTYYSAEDIAASNGKEYKYDKRGLCIFSDESFPYSDSENFTHLFDNADYIFRYLMFENPEGEDVLSAYESGKMYKKHPRILYTEDEINYIKSKCESDSDIKIAINNSVKAADKILIQTNPYSSDCPDSSKQISARQFQNDIQTLAEAYLVTSDSAYADKAAEYISVMCEWTSLSYGVSNLTTGHWAMGMAIGYDSFYNYFSSFDEGKELLLKIKNASVRMAYADTIRAYKGGGGAHWITINDNFSGVIGGGMHALCWALADESDIREENSYLLENIIKSNELAVSLYYPDGGFFEGLGYSEYMLSNLVIALETLCRCTDDDYGLLNAPGFAEAGDFFVYLQGKNNVLNFHDSTSTAINTWLPSWFAYRFGNIAAGEMNIQQMKIRGCVPDIRCLLYMNLAVDNYGDTNSELNKKDRYFSHTEAGSFRNSFNTSEPVFAGFHGGRTNLSHDMLDLGQFVFESDGISWAIDLGSDDYSLPGYFAREGYKLYRKRPEGENCIVINPSVDTDTYYGQALGVSAELIDFSTAPTCAKAAYDLTDAYARDAVKYIRGYYFGDNRNTLTVQDEISLKNPDSELYWFMHTAADIEIVNNSQAVLTKNGKKLRVEVICTSSDYELLSMDASPLPSSPVVEGQNQNSSYRKLAIHLPSADGEVTISVKLIPINDYYTPVSLECVPISEWTLADDDYICDTAITDVVADSNGNVTCKIQLPEKFESATLYSDGVSVYSIDNPYPLRETLQFHIDGLKSGNHELLLVAEANGKKFFDSCRFNCDSRYSTTSISDTLQTYNGTAVNGADIGWTLSSYGTNLAADDGFKLGMGSKSYVALSYRASKSDYAFSDGVFEVECDISLSEAGQFVFECQNQAGNWYMYEKSVFKKDGTFADGTKYETDHWYHIRLIVDCINKKCMVYADENPVIENYIQSSVNSIYVCKLQYVGQSAESSVSYKNLKIRRIGDIKQQLSATYSPKDNCVESILSLSEDVSGTYDVITAIYRADTKKLIYADISANPFFDKKAYINIPLSDSDTYIKQFIFESGSIKPAFAPLYKTVYQ